MNIKNRRETEIKIFMKHGANRDLADVMSGVFGPLGWSPPVKELNQRIKNAQIHLDYQYLAYSMLLKGNTQKAKEYLMRANKLRPARSYDLLIKHINKVQEIITKSKEEFNELRVKRGLGRFDEYL